MSTRNPNDSLNNDGTYIRKATEHGNRLYADYLKLVEKRDSDSTFRDFVFVTIGCLMKNLTQEQEIKEAASDIVESIMHAVQAGPPT